MALSLFPFLIDFKKAKDNEFGQEEIVYQTVSIFNRL